MKKLKTLSIVNMKNVVDLFIKLVQIDSPSGHEQDVITFVKNWADKIGLNYQIDKSGNILVKHQGIGQPILFCVHMDTVEPGKGIKPIIKNGVVKSLGNTILGADNKAAIACLLTTVERYLKKEKKPKAIELLFTVKEETCGGLESFPFNWIQSKAGFTFDSAKPLGGIILKSPYIYNFYAEIKGKSCHSSNPDDGINAFSPAIKALSKIKTGKLDGGSTTINIGKIEGGTGVNIVPDKIKISGEVRSYSKLLIEKHLTKIKKIFLDKLQNNYCQIKFWSDGFCPGYQHQKDSLLIKKVGEIYKKIGLKSKYYYYSGISDANILNQAGIKTINLTDGVNNSHSTNESIIIKDLKKLTEIIYTFLLSY